MNDTFEGTRHQPGIETTVLADKGISEKAPSIREVIHQAYIKAGDRGLTDDEAAQATGMLDTCYWKRCNELRQEGFIVDTGHKRMGLKNRMRIVCVAA